MLITNVTGNYFLKENDTATEIHLAIQEVDGTPVDLSTAARVEVVIGTLEGRYLTKTPTLLQATGEFTFGLDEGDMLPIGDNLVEVYIYDQNGEKRVAPSKGHYKMRVQQSLGSLGMVVTTYTLDYFISEVNRITYGLPELVDRTQQLANRMDGLILDAETALDKSETALSTVQGAIAEVVPAIQESKTTTQQAKDARDKANVAAALADGIATSLLGYDIAMADFSLATRFVKHQLVRSNGSTFKAKKETTGNPLPVAPARENEWWSLVAEKGATGNTGPKGDPGPRGETGEKGEMGTGINVLGEFAEPADLPTTGSIGDAYLIQGNLWVWGGTRWIDGGNIQGPRGEKGATGEKGEKGADGKSLEFEWDSTFLGVKAEGDAEFIYTDLKGPKGDPGEKGATGETGAAGSDATVTTAAIEGALGYIPADKATVDGHETRLVQLESGSSTVKADVSGLTREMAYFKLKQSAEDRIEGGVLFADDFNGTRFGFDLKRAKTLTNKPLVAGETKLADKIGAIENGNFTVGSEVTVLGPANSEKVTITRSELEVVTTPYAATDSTVVASAYSTSGNGGRKLVRLDNGWLVAGALQSGTGVKLYVLKDINGSWQPLCYRDGSAISDFSLACKGNIVYLLYVSTATSIVNYSIDATKVSNVNINTAVEGVVNGVTLDASQTAIGNISLAIDPSNGHLHAAWISKNSSFPNSFNIRYAKSTDGGVTWSAVAQVTVDNNTSFNWSNPSIVLFNGLPRIVAAYNGNNINNIFLKVFDGEKWRNDYVTIHAGGTYVQSNPSAVVGKDGVIHVAWDGRDATNNNPNIRYSSSSDGGITWSPMEKLTVGGTNQWFPSITVDSANTVFILWQGLDTAVHASYQHIRQISKPKNGTWGSILTTTNVANGIQTSPSTLFDPNYDLEFSRPISVHISSEKVFFNGDWKKVEEIHHLESSPLKNAYPANTIISESTINEDGTFMNALDLVSHNVTDKTVVASAHSTAGNGGRKLVRLDDRSLFAATREGSAGSSIVKVYKSIDDGNNWELFKSVTIGGTGGFSLVSMGDKIGLLHVRGDTIVDFKSYYVDGSNYTSKTGLEVSQTALGELSLAIDPSNGHLHAAWSSKNSTYLNGFNIRYSKSTDGGATWSAVEQITKDNTAGRDWNRPSIVVRSGGSPLIITDRTLTGYMDIYAFGDGLPETATNLGWRGSKIYTGGTYVQSNSSAVVGKDDVIHVAWLGNDSVDGAEYANGNIFYSSSSDGGVTWSAATKLTSGKGGYRDAPSITVDSDGKLFVLYKRFSSYNQIAMVTKSGGTWTTEQIITSHTSGPNPILYPSTLVDTDLKYTIPPYIYNNNTNNGVLFNGDWSQTFHTPTTGARAVYSIPSTNFVGFYLLTQDDVAAEVTVNGEVIEGKSVDGELKYVTQLPSVQPVNLALNLSRTNVDGGSNDKLVRILGGRA